MQLLAVLINGCYNVTVNPEQEAGTIVVDGTSHCYGDNPVNFAGKQVVRGRASSVSIKGASVSEFVAALVLLGIKVRGNILSAYSVNPRLGSGQGQLEQIRAALSSSQGLVLFIVRVCDGNARPHIQVAPPTPPARSASARPVPQRA